MSRLIKNTSQRGFTLVEVLIYSLIISGMASSVIFFSLTILESQEKARSYQEVQQNARFAMNRMIREINSASSFSTSSSTFETHPGVLYLTNPDSSKNPTVFSVVNSRIQMAQGTSSPVFLTSENVEVARLIFEDLSFADRTENIKIILSIDHQNPENLSILSGTTTMEVSTTIRAREDLP